MLKASMWKDKLHKILIEPSNWKVKRKKNDTKQINIKSRQSNINSAQPILSRTKVGSLAHTHNSRKRYMTDAP